MLRNIRLQKLKQWVTDGAPMQELTVFWRRWTAESTPILCGGRGAWGSWESCSGHALAQWGWQVAIGGL